MQKMIRRRPQTTKRLNNGISNLGLKKDSSMLTSVQQDTAINYNEAALLKTQQHMIESQKRGESTAGDGVDVQEAAHALIASSD